MKELRIIQEIRERAGSAGGGVKVGIGDDCAVLDHDDKHYLLWATDMLVEGTHFRIAKTSYKAIGRKAVAVNISDIAAMGGLPKYITVTIGAPRKLKQACIRNIYDGIFAICKEYGIKVVGGDTNRSRNLVIDVSIMGLVEKDRLLRRSGAGEKELVLVTGPVRNGKKEHFDFVPRVKESRFLSQRYKVTSMIDTSDGIAMDVGRICTESGVGCRIYASSIPLSKGLALEDALYYGESFELLFTMGIKEARKLFKNMRYWSRSFGFYIIGETVPRKKGMRLIGKNGKAGELQMKGFTHL